MDSESAFVRVKVSNRYRYSERERERKVEFVLLSDSQSSSCLYVLYVPINMYVPPM